MERPRDRENCTGNNKAIRRTTEGAEGDELNFEQNQPLLPFLPLAYTRWYRTISRNITFACLSFHDVPFNLIVFLPLQEGAGNRRVIVLLRSVRHTESSRNIFLPPLSVSWYMIFYIYRIFDLLNLIRDSFNFEIKKKIIKRFVSMDWLSLKIVITVVSMRCVRCFDWKYAPCALEWQIICLNNIPGVMYRIQYIPKFVWISNCDADYTIHSTMLINSWPGKCANPNFPPLNTIKTKICVTPALRLSHIFALG